MSDRYPNANYGPPAHPGLSTPESNSSYYAANQNQNARQQYGGPPPPPPSFPNMSSPAQTSPYYPPQQYTPPYQQALPQQNISAELPTTGLSRQLSYDQITSLGIRPPDSNNGMSSNFFNPPQPSPGAGSFAATLGSPSYGYGGNYYHNQFPSPPTSGNGPPISNGPPVLNTNFPSYSAPPQSNGHPYQGNPNYPQYGTPGQQGPPTILTANLGVAGYADSPDMRYSQSANPTGYGQDNASPLRTASIDANGSGLPPSPNRKTERNPRRTNTRIDPSQMPRPIRPSEGLIYTTNSGTTTSSGRKIPPTSCVNFKVVDTGNCSPRCLRLTTTAPPATKEIANMTGIPVAIAFTPFAPPEGTEEPVPAVDAGETPPRCSRCRGYINCHVVWSDGGNKWTCNLCSMVNNIPQYYYSALDGMGLRLDRKQRPELTHGSVDFLVGKDFSLRSLQEPIYVYAVDISQRAVASGLTAASLAAIRANIGYLPGPADRIRVGILTFDRSIHFYSVKEDSSGDPVRILVCDSEDPSPALPHTSWVMPLVAKLSAITILLDKIPELIPALQGYDRDGNMTRSHPSMNSRNTQQTSPSSGNAQPYEEYAQTCPSAVMKVVQQALSDIGGRLFIFSSFSSNVGFGKVTSVGRESQGVNELGAYATASNALLTADSRKASAEEKALLSSYIELARLCSKSYVSVDVLVASESDYLFPDYALLSEVSEQTGGNFHVFSGQLTVEENQIRLQQQVFAMQQSISGFEVMMKVRCSNGFRVEKIYGRGNYDENVNELEVASINTTSSYCAILKHDAALKDDDRVYIQLAVLYTSASTTRRFVRVHNITTTASTVAQQVFRHADLDATVDVILKTAIDRALRFPLSADKEGPRAYLTDTAIEILQKYRANCSPDSARGQLILPESLKLLPLYTLCALKHPSLLDNFPGGDAKGIASGRGAPLQVRSYERAYELRRLRSLPAGQLMNSLYPRLYALHQLEEGDGEPLNLLDGLVVTKMPPMVPTISEVLDTDGMYLLDDGGALFLFIGRGVSPQKLEDIFGIPTYSGGIYDKPKNLTFNVAGSADAARIVAAIEELRRGNWNKQELKVIWAGEPAGSDGVRFSLRLVEDSIYGNASYVDFLCKIHAKIQNRGT